MELVKVMEKKTLDEEITVKREYSVPGIKITMFKGDIKTDIYSGIAEGVYTDDGVGTLDNNYAKSAAGLTPVSAAEIMQIN